MKNGIYAIETQDLKRKFGKTYAVNGLSLKVKKGSCFGFFGRNGAGKTTTIKCLLNLLHPDKGRIEIFGMDPRKKEVEVKSKLAYVPENVAFYPWMTVQDTLDYSASFRKHWNKELEKNLLERFDLDPSKKTTDLSRGMKAQLSLICAICPEADLLILDEPTSGLDPIIRREFIRTVIGAFQEGDPENRTVFVSTHLISEFEGLIDDFTIINKGQDIISLDADTARKKFRKITMFFNGDVPEISHNDIVSVSGEGRELELITNNYSKELIQYLKSCEPEKLKEENLSLEEIFISTADMKGNKK
jgi:ABC-type multidrug transport system ATPase subunit